MRRKARFEFFGHSAVHIVRGPVKVAGAVGVLLEGGQEPCPETRFTPAIKTAGDGAPRTIPLGEVTPWGTRAEKPQHPVDDPAVVNGRTACFRLLGWE